MRRYLPDVASLVLLFLLPLVMFWSQTIGGKTLIPTENLYQFPPYATYREQVGVPEVPHNALVSDLVLQNYQWKSLIREQIAAGEVPLWNPHQFSGIPFMAAGQQSTLYPLSVLYYVLPLPAAYGWFTVVTLLMAGAFMYAFLRGLGAGWFGGLVAGITYQLCGFFIASAVFPMILAAAAWLPLLLLMIEFVIRRQPLFGRPATAPWVVGGAVALACNIFAGHVEIMIYTLLITAFYAAGRLISLIGRPHEVAASTHDGNGGWMANIRPIVARSGWLAVMVALGIGLGALQLIPLYEVANENFRSTRTDLQTVLSFAHPPRDVIQYAMPNFFGSPAQHSYFDWFGMETRPVTVNSSGVAVNNTEWGIKNYVEGALYVGILPLLLAGFAVVVSRLHRRRFTHTVIFALLTLVSLTFMFGLPTYAAIYWLPGINQLNSAFRWVYGVTLGVAILAGFGADTLFRLQTDAIRKWARRFGAGLIVVGGLLLIGLAVSRVMYAQLEPAIERIMNSLAAGQGASVAADRYADAAMFYSAQLTNALIFAVMVVLSGLVFWFAARAQQSFSQQPPAQPSPEPGEEPESPVRDSRSEDGVKSYGGALRAWPLFAVGIVAVDLLVASWGFNPASDPEWLDFTPPVVEWMQEQQAGGEPFRYITLEAPAQGLDTMLQANMTLRYGLDDVRGYDSIIPLQYVDYMRRVQVQPQLDFNRVAPLYLDRVEAGEVDWRRLDLLNVRYVVTHPGIMLPVELIESQTVRPSARLELIYEDDAVRVYENTLALPRVYLALRPPVIDWSPESEFDYGSLITSWDGATITSDTGREKFVDVDFRSDTDWLVVSETYAEGWRAFVRPRAGENASGEVIEKPLDVVRVLENFQGVDLSREVVDAVFADVYDDLTEDQQSALDAGELTMRLVYSPTTFQVGMFGSVISAALLAFVIGVWIWRLFVTPAADDDAAVSRVARNSLAPIILNLFNRGIDFVFAFVMLRILGPEDAGIYYYAIVVFVWFDIFTNFGLDVFLIREASRARERAGYFFANTTALRLLLMLAGIPLVIGFIFVRQSSIDPALNREALLAIGLLYIGLAPGSLNKGLTSLYYAFEKAEYPAAVTTISTINRVVLQLGALLLGYGIVGLAAMSIFVNIITLGILFYGAREMLGRVWNNRPNPGLMRGMMGESWPLMLNHFLATIFFQIDVVILEALRGARIVGQYSVAYRWLLALNIIPAFFTQALLPVMSRQANEDRDAFKRTYTLAVKLMVAVSLPFAVAFTVLAEPLTLLLGGQEFLPVGAIALQIMIWSIPIGWINSVTQYALVALDLQRMITRAFAVAVSFNIITNLIFIPEFGYRAAAVTTIFSEIVLLFPFVLLMHRALGWINWWGMVWRPAMAALVMGIVLLVGWTIMPLLALMAAGIVYPALLLALRPLSADELRMLSPVLPAQIRQMIPSDTPGQ